mmetsp:Transcript_20463/g.68346  ORF Transcript_20463/g.68346 Transcript_20463/m.68346 type:complete len:86 (+) Transcript_20463:1246-1503(+)
MFLRCMEPLPFVCLTCAEPRYFLSIKEAEQDVKNAYEMCIAYLEKADGAHDGEHFNSILIRHNELIMHREIKGEWQAEPTSMARQ